MSMQNHHIAGALNLPLALSPESERGVNAWAAKLHHSNTPLLSLGSVHPDTTDPENILSWIQSLGLPGIKLHAEFQHFTPGESRMYPIYRVCEKLGLFILFHTGVDLIFENAVPSAVLTDFLSISQDFPNLKIILAHMGGIETLSSTRPSFHGRNVWFDLAYVPNQVTPTQLTAVIRDLGADKVLYGTDSPWYDHGEHLKQFLQCDLSDDEFHQILFENAVGFLPEIEALKK